MTGCEKRVVSKSAGLVHRTWRVFWRCMPAEIPAIRPESARRPDSSGPGPR